MTPPRPGADRPRLAEQLSAARRRRGLSVRALAAACGLPASTIQGWLSGAHLPGPGLRREFTALLEALGLTEERPAEQWWEDVNRSRVPGQPATTPYVGLRAYRPEDEAHFFGRAAEVAELGARVAALAGADGPRILAVVGASGAGKSSLLGAGLLGRLRAEGQPLHGWSAVATTPGLDPEERLSRALAAGPDLLVVDQLEELWTGAPDPDRPGRFLDRLAAAGRDRVVVLGLRADFFGAASRHAELRPALERPVLLGALSREQLRRIVVGPAEAVGARVSPDLVGVILRDVAPRGTEIGVGLLPMLSQALLGTWEHARTHELTVADYHAAGGITEAVDRRAEEVHAGLDLHEQEVARAVFLRLVRVVGTGSSATVVRTPVLREELPGGGAAVVEHFARARLLTIDREEIQLGHEALLDRWARLGRWIEDSRRDLYVRQQLQRATRMWLANDRDPLALIPLGQLASFRDWTGDPRQEALLSPAEREYLEESERHYDDALAEQQRSAREIERRGRVALVLLVLAVCAAVVAGTLGVRAERFQAVAESARDEALSRQAALEASRIRGETPNLAAQLGLAAHDIAPTLEGRSALLDATAVTSPRRWLGTDGPARLTGLPDGTLLARASADGQLSVWRRTGDGPAVREDLVAAEGRDLFDVDVQRVGERVLLLVVGDGHASLWDATGATTARLTDLAGIGDATLRAARIDARAGEAWVGGPGVLRRYSLGEPGGPAPLPAPDVDGTAVSSIAGHEDGIVYVGGAEQGILRYRVADGELEELPVIGTDRRVQALAVSPDGSRLLAGLAERAVARFDLTRGARPLEPLRGFGSWVNDVSWSPDGRHLAVASSDQSVYLFQEGRAEPVDVYRTPAAATGAVIAGDRVVSVSTDGVVRAWPPDPPDFYHRGEPLYQLSSGRGGTVLSAVGIARGGSGVISLFDLSGEMPEALPSPPVPEGETSWYAGAVAPGGDLLAGGSQDGTALVWPLSPEGTTGPARTVDAVEDAITGADVRADGELLAVWSEVGSEVALVRRAPGGALSKVGAVPAERPQSVRFSPDGALLAVADVDERVSLWEVGDGAAARHVTDLATPVMTTAVAFSPDGRLLAAGGSEGHLRLWSLEDPAAPRHVLTRQDALSIVRGLHFAPDGSAVAAASGDRYVWVWSVDGSGDAARVEVDAALSAGGTRMADVRFVGGGQLLGTGDDGTVRRWIVDEQAAAAHVCGQRGDPITEDEWRRHLPGAPYRELC